MTLLSFPKIALVDPKKIVPDEADVLALLTPQYLIVLPNASFMNWMAGLAPAFVFEIDNIDVVPVPPARPSIVTLSPPAKLKVAVVLAVVMLIAALTLASGRMVKLLVLDIHALEEKVIG